MISSTCVVAKDTATKSCNKSVSQSIDEVLNGAQTQYRTKKVAVTHQIGATSDALSILWKHSIKLQNSSKIYILYFIYKTQQFQFREFLFMHPAYRLIVCACWLTVKNTSFVFMWRISKQDIASFLSKLDQNTFVLRLKIT